MYVESLFLNEVKIIKPDIFYDDRGYFYESFNDQKYKKVLKLQHSFVQDNHSKSSKYILRGLHYQKKPFEQGKLVRVIRGKIFDVAVDIRKKSSTYGHWVGAVISASNKKQIWIPRGFAHGFLVLSNIAEVIYKTDNYYSKKHEVSLPWNSSDFGIEWPISDISLINTSAKDSV